MSHFFFILVQLPYIILSLVCGISVIISNWNEYFANKEQQAKTIYMLAESTGVETESDIDLVSMAA